MIYSTHREGVARRFNAICKAHPNLRFSLAQSVEKVLPVSESYFENGAERFESSMKQLYQDMGAGALSNVSGLLVQSFEDYVSMSNLSANQ